MPSIWCIRFARPNRNSHFSHVQRTERKGVSCWMGRHSIIVPHSIEVEMLFRRLKRDKAFHALQPFRFFLNTLEKLHMLLLLSNRGPWRRKLFITCISLPKPEHFPIETHFYLITIFPSKLFASFGGLFCANCQFFIAISHGQDWKLFHIFSKVFIYPSANLIFMEFQIEHIQYSRQPHIGTYSGNSVNQCSTINRLLLPSYHSVLNANETTHGNNWITTGWWITFLLLA